MVNEILKQLEFGDKEITVYLNILQHGKVIPSDIAKVTGINRSTVYSIAKELIKKGVITEDLGGPNRYLVARPPKDLELLLEKESKKIKKKKELVSKAIHELQTFTKDTKYSIPKIVFISDEEVGNYLYKQTPVWNESILKVDETKSWWGFQDHHFVRHYEEWIDWFWQTGGAPKELVLHLLSDDTAEKIKGEKQSRRRIKFWKHNQNFTSTVWILGDYLVMIVTSAHPHYLVEIHDVVLAHNMREVFKGLWRVVK
jgi:sugar-specific transcriptional regulator TrmB